MIIVDCEKGCIDVKKEVIRSLSLVSQLGFSVMVPTFMCIGIGILIDNKFGTSTTVWLLFLGLAAGFRNAVILAKAVMKENSKTSSDRYKKYEREELWQDEDNKN